MAGGGPEAILVPIYDGPGPTGRAMAFVDGSNDWWAELSFDNEYVEFDPKHLEATILALRALQTKLELAGVRTGA